MRYDDMLATVLAQPAEGGGALAAAWMQTVDILSQSRMTISPSKRQVAFEKLRSLRSRISVERRRAVSMMIAGQALPLDVVAFFGADAPVVAAPLLSRAQLSEEQWTQLLPNLPATSRALLRERRDMPARVSAMLSSFGNADFALPVSQTRQSPLFADAEDGGADRELLLDSPLGDGAAQISELVARIENYRKEHGERGPFFQQPEQQRKPQQGKGGFRFEAESDGQIYWADCDWPGAVIGIAISRIAQAGEHGVDGHAAGAFRKRAPFRDARLVVPGKSELSGTWLISGTPWFNSQDGRFKGYRCTARRPLHTESLGVADTGLLGPDLPADSLRQLVHELRTPLNAIRGFAEMIEGQLLGAVAPAYRSRAKSIISDSNRLLALFEDLDVAARLEQSDMRHDGSTTSDARRLLHKTSADLASLTDDRGVHLRVNSGNDALLLRLDNLGTERVYSRLLATVLGLSAPGEIIEARLAMVGDAVDLSVSRPKALSGIDEQKLLDPSFALNSVGDNAPVLGLGFSLRLISNLARAAQGHLILDPDQFVLRLPLVVVETSNGTRD